MLRGRFLCPGTGVRGSRGVLSEARCDFLVHYGHSCLVPTDRCLIPTLYVFVSISFEPQHLIDTIVANFEPGLPLCLMGTIQFAAALPAVRSTPGERPRLTGRSTALLRSGFGSIAIPQASPASLQPLKGSCQAKPLSPGEVLGCTAPTLAPELGQLVFVCDGRFHLEAVMIANPKLKAFKYDPYSQKLTSEGCPARRPPVTSPGSYDHDQMLEIRHQATSTASRVAQLPEKAKFGIVLGTLGLPRQLLGSDRAAGRQGAPHILDHLEGLLKERSLEYFIVLLSEIFPEKLAMFGADVDVWVQIACPRLSIDWGYAFHKPLLSPYEAVTALNGMEGWRDVYPMDFYKKESGPWGASQLKPELKQQQPTLQATATQ